jgi:uncharacterized membrane protein YraQ (UPF0718 family)
MVNFWQINCKSLKSESTNTSLNLALVLFPFWLIIFYFREKITGWLVYSLFDFSSGNRTAGILVFFVSTLLKISLLLVLVIFLLSLIRSWLPSFKVKKLLGSVHPVVSNILAGILGVATPFCSCSAVPVFIGFLEAGVPLGTTFTFLIASPLVNEIILIMLAGLFGIKVTLIYLFAGLSIAIIGGMVITRLNMEKYLPAWLLSFRNERAPDEKISGLNDRVQLAFKSVKETIARTWIYILAGVIVGALIHGYVPDKWLSTFMADNSWYKLPLTVMAGIPLYACSAAVVPVAFALTDHGVPPGTAMAFIMSVAALSLPEFIMLKKIISTRLILIFISIVFIGILIVGYLFNWLL